MAARSKAKAKELERVTDCPKDKAYYENAVWECIKEYYYTEYGAETVEQISKLPQNSFVAACEFARRSCINRADLLTTTPHPLNGNGSKTVAYNESYDAERVELLCSVYISICFRLDRVPSIYGFAVLSGIDRTTIQVWVQEQGQGVTMQSRRNTPKRSVENIRAARAVSLQNVAITGGRGTVGSLACLNNEYWGANIPEQPKQTGVSTAAALPVFNSETGGLLADQGGELLALPGADRDAVALPVLGNE